MPPKRRASPRPAERPSARAAGARPRRWKAKARSRAPPEPEPEPEPELTPAQEMEATIRRAAAEKARREKQRAGAVGTAIGRASEACHATPLSGSGPTSPPAVGSRDARKLVARGSSRARAERRPASSPWCGCCAAPPTPPNLEPPSPHVDTTPGQVALPREPETAAWRLGDFPSACVEPIEAQGEAHTPTGRVRLRVVQDWAPDASKDGYLTLTTGDIVRCLPPPAPLPPAETVRGVV